MAPSSRLEEKLRKLGLSNDDGGSSRSTPASKAKYTFRIYFPQPPYDGLQFNALKSGAGYNFTGQLLGVGGKQLQRIKQESSARVEVVNAQGNLNGAHPDPLDLDLHALITADSMSKLQKAANMVWELLQPANARFLPMDVVPGGSMRLIVAQAKAAASKASVQQAAAKVYNSSQQQSVPASEEMSPKTAAAAAASRPCSVSPALTPVTPAATAGRPGSFSGNCSVNATTPNSCSSQGYSSPALTAGSEHSSSSTVNSRNSSNVRSLFSNLEGFSLPPAAVLPAAAKPTAPGASESETSTPMAALRAAPGAAAVPQASGAVLGSTAPEQQPQQPPPGVDAGADLSSAPGNQEPAAAGSGEACLPLPGTVQKPDQPSSRQQHGHRPTVGPEPSNGSCSSCFQYGLGLCTSSSFDSTLSGSCKESPMLRALIEDHQRQQQAAEQMQSQLQQQFEVSGSSQGVYNPMGFQSPLLGSLVGSFEGESLSLGPGALSGSLLNTSGPLSKGLPGHLAGRLRPGPLSLPTPEQQLQEHMLAMAAGECMVGSFGASCAGPGIPAGFGVPARGLAPPAALSQGLPGGGLAGSGNWAAPAEMPPPRMMYGTPPGAAVFGAGILPPPGAGKWGMSNLGGSGMVPPMSLNAESAWMMAQQEVQQIQQQQQQQGMLEMMQAQQNAGPWSQEQGSVLYAATPNGMYRHPGAALEQPGAMSSIW